VSPRAEAYRKFIVEVPNEGLIRLKGLLNRDQLLVTDAKALAEILVTRTYDFPKQKRDTDFLRYLIGDGLVTTEGAHHKQQRKHSMPSFGFRQIKNLYPLFWEKSIKMTQVIDTAVWGSLAVETGSKVDPKEVIDIDHWASKATLDIIGVAGLGRDLNTLDNSHDEIAVLYEELTATDFSTLLISSMMLILGRRLAALLYPTAFIRIRNIIIGLRRLCVQFVREKRTQLQNRDEKPLDTLSNLIKAGVFSDEELVDQLLTFLAAG
jgi:cytochrome P450